MEEVNHDRIQAASLFFNSLLGVNRQPSNVRAYVEQFEELCLTVAKVALAATRDIPETVM
jgi:hypothetical protein